MLKANSTLIAKIKDASDVFRHCSKRLKILSVLSWPGPVADAFFKKKESQLPEPKYEVDRAGVLDLLQRLKELQPRIKGEHPVLLWLERTRESYALAAQLLLDVGTPQLYEISSRLYGSARSKLFESKLTNLELANSLSSRMSVCKVNEISESTVLKSADEFAESLRLRLLTRAPQMPVKIEITNDISAKVVAGMNRVRVRKDARFSDLEVDALWNHEIESHALTATNGLSQKNCDFLCAGGPRTTLTQEGLAVFFEMYGHSMSQRRFLALCDRVHALTMAEDGATFMDVYRWYKERADTPLEAFFAASRIFRGSPNLEKGGFPFTKDVVYLGGLLGVFNFLQLAVKNQNYLLVESLVCGRVALEDVGVIAYLRTHDILTPPAYIPDWLKNWEALLSFFSFSAFINSVDLSSFQQYIDGQSEFSRWDFSL